MQAAAAPVSVHRPLPPEEAARADFYALIARLLHSAPDARLLAGLASAPDLPDDGDPALAKAWRELVQASAAMDPEAALEEFELLFIGIGKSQVSPYAGFYAGAPAADHPRVRIQADLADLGLERRPETTEPEDHLAGLLDVMRVLVAGGSGRAPAALQVQRRFFDRHLRAALPAFFGAVGHSPSANYYRRVAGFGAAFTVLETESFSLE